MPGMKKYFRDIIGTCGKIRVIIFFAKTDTESRYKRSILGPLWLTLGTMIGVLGLGIVWSQILNIDSKDFIPNMAIGLVCWQLIANCVAESPSLYMRYAGILKNTPQPMFFYPMLLVSRNIVNFLHNILVVILVMIYYEIPVSFETLYVLPALLIVFINLIFLSQILGVIGARYRDLEPTINAFLPLLFFITPIIYKPSQVKVASWVIDFNPLAYYVTIIRDTVLGTPISAQIISGLFIITSVVFIGGVVISNMQKKKITLWL